MTRLGAWALVMILSGLAIWYKPSCDRAMEPPKVDTLADGKLMKKKKLSGRRITSLCKMTGQNWEHKETWRAYGINPRPARGGWYKEERNVAV